MLRTATGVLFGLVLLSTRATAVDPSAALAFGAIAVLALRWRPARFPAAVLAGYCWAAFSVHSELESRWPAERWNAELTAEFRILDFPRVDAGRIRFLAAPLDDTTGIPARVRLAWYDTDARPRPGERWRLRLRLRTPRGFANAGLFDYERWLFVNRIGATGYVVGDSANALTRAAPPYSVGALRWRLAERLAASLPDDRAVGVIVALAVGSRHRLDATTRDTFVTTGTSHLMAISGLHVGLVAGIGIAVGRALAALAAFCGLGRVSWAPAAAVGFAFALAYSALAGFAVPTQRACLMLAIALAALLAGRRLISLRSLAGAFLILFAVDPLGPLSASFQLSFCAVALLMALRARDLAGVRPTQRSWSGAVRWQLMLSVLSVPLTWLLFGQVSLVSPLANLLAIPWFSFVVVPLLVVSLPWVATVGGGPLPELTHGAVETALLVLDRLAAMPYADARPGLPAAAGIVAVAGACTVACSPLAARLRAVIAGLLLALGMPPPWQGPQHDCLRATLFDVGQGLAALVETRGHVLLFDAGPRFSGGTDAAQLVVVPALKKRGIDRIDTLVVSHGDADHAGGLATVLAELSVTRLLRSEPLAPEPGAAVSCRAGQRWYADGVRFEVLHPDGEAGGGNDASCVLRVAAGDEAVLLTGDIEAAAERRLLRSQPAALASTIVVVPHHGSRTSSLPEFVRAVGASHAWVSAGYRNRWGFPKAEVVRRWEASGAGLASTGERGMLSATLCANGRREIDAGFRRASPRFWRAREP